MLHDDYTVVNIRDYFPKDMDGVTREETLKDTISGFSCPLNQNVEKFLKEQAIEFTKKNLISLCKSFLEIQEPFFPKKVLRSPKANKKSAFAHKT